MPTRIAILYPISIPWVARCMDGIKLYAQAKGGWHIFSSPPSLRGAEETAMNLHSLRGWKGDGIIIASNDKKELSLAGKMRTPVINLAGGLADTCAIPRVMVNHYEAGGLAAEHLIDQGLSQLAYFGWKHLWYSEQRYRGFCDRAAAFGTECHVLLRETAGDTNLSWTEQMTALGHWLKSLPLPCGIFAMNDFWAQLLMEACSEVGLRMPEDIAVIGMDNNEIICEHSTPTLTSIGRSSKRVGYEAAALLDRMIMGEPDLPEEVLISPSEIIFRESSDMLYCSDPLVRQAIEFMREHLREQFNMDTVAGHLGISKRKLERKFSEAVNSSPRQHLIKLRINHAKALIKREPDRTVQNIAQACGFSTMPTFYTSFQRLAGLSPAKFSNRNAASENTPPE